MAEVREYLAPDIFIPWRGSYSRVREKVEELLRGLENRGYDIRFERNETGIAICAYDRQGRPRRLYAVVRKRENEKLLSWLDSLGY